MLVTLIILILSAAFFVSGKVRSDIVALCALIGLLVFQILTPEEALSGFSNSVVIMMVGLFVVGGAIFQTGLAKMISSRILKLAGKSELRLGFCEQYGNGCPDASYRSKPCHECGHESRTLADASCLCKQYGRYDDAYRYASQFGYPRHVGPCRIRAFIFLLVLTGRLDLYAHIRAFVVLLVLAGRLDLYAHRHCGLVAAHQMVPFKTEEEG